jgi:predicted transcriptional regulator
MAKDKQTVHLSLTVSPELNDRLEQLASLGHTTKSEVLRKAIALFDVVSEAAADKKRFGILDEDKKLVTEIVGI